MKKVLDFELEMILVQCEGQNEVTIDTEHLVSIVNELMDYREITKKPRFREERVVMRQGETPADFILRVVLDVQRANETYPDR